jgi:hypothetical protein
MIAAVLIAAATALPAKLSDTGLFEPGSQRVRAAHVAFTPRYPLWSDGTAKRRWMSLPAGTAIDATDPDALRFPVGTRFWKEFSYGTRVETRYSERTPGGWRFATYVWSADGSDAYLAPEEGVTLPVAGAPGGRYEVPSRSDCVVCHEGAPVPVLGYSTVQLARAPEASLESDALGYLHGNCGHCHNAGALEGIEMRLARSAAHDTTAAARSAVLARAERILTRMRSLDPLVRMPPIGTRAVDEQGVGLVERWIRDLQLQLQRQEKP